MTPQEHEKLQQFLNQMRQAQGVQRDPEADAIINDAVARQPDAAYLLVQRTLLQDQAIEAARARIAELERQQQQAPKPASSFLGGADDWGNSARSRPSAGMPAVAASAPYPQQPGFQGRYPSEPAPRQGAMSRFGMGGGMGGGGGSFLGTMAATAAGVAGGAFLFQGLGSLLGGNGGDEAGKQSAASDTGAESAASGESNLAQDAGLNDVGSAPSQEQGLMDDTAAFDDPGMDDFGGGDDSMV